MKYLKIRTSQNNTVVETSGSTFTDLRPDEIQVQSDFDFPYKQPTYFYRWDDTLSGVTVNDDETIENYHKDPIFKIYNYMGSNDHDRYAAPYDYDFNLYGLSKVRTFDKGQLEKIEYYGTVSGETYDDLVLIEYRDFYRKDRMVYKRKMHIDWYLTDDTIGAHKTSYKHYTPEESLKLGERRRRNVVSDMKINTIGLLEIISGITQEQATLIGMTFLAEITTEIGSYVEGIEDPLKNAVLTNTNHSWLDDQVPGAPPGFRVRDYLYDNINIDYSDNIG